MVGASAGHGPIEPVQLQGDILEGVRGVVLVQCEIEEVGGYQQQVGEGPAYLRHG